jgi:hypothetical protein
MESAKCPICGSDFFEIFPEKNNEYHCNSCGNYKLDCKAEEVKTLTNLTEDKLCNFAGYLFETNRSSETFKLIKLKKVNPDEFCFEDEVYSSGLVPKTALQKIDKLLTNLYILSVSPIQSYKYDLTMGLWRAEISDDDYKSRYKAPIAYVSYSNQLSSIIQTAIQNDFIKFKPHEYLYGFDEIELTYKGLQRAESLVSEKVESNQIFIAFKFNDPDSGVFRKEFEESIKQACETASNNIIKAIILPDVEYNDGISDRIKYEIRRSKAVIADYTYESPNVYFEAGYADALGIPIIRCCNKEWADKYKGGEEKAVHFDERHNNLIFWNDYDELKIRVENRIKNLFM